MKIPESCGGWIAFAWEKRYYTYPAGQGKSFSAVAILYSSDGLHS
jgi:hypothetical protein